MKRIRNGRSLLASCVVVSMLFLLNGALWAQQKKAPLGEADGETPGVRVEVTELKRMSGDTLNLKFVMINDSAKEVDFNYNFTESGHSDIDFNSIGGVHLIDAVDKKKYLVVRDAEKKCVCSTGLKTLQPKSRVNLWAKFPAPPDGVQKITVVIPHFQPMDDVPINR